MMDFGKDISNCTRILSEGGIIIYPTDTIWGIGCDATNNKAVERLFSIKKREADKSLIILIDSEAMLERYVREVPDVVYQLIEVSESPLTIIYPEGKNLASGVCAPDGSVGIRICKEPFCDQLIGRTRRPLVSTSANFSGAPTPSSFREIDDKLLSKVDYTTDYRRTETGPGKASSIIKVNADGTLVILRK